MDCKQAEIFIMQHFEKKIAPENARALVSHVLTCEGCRENYLALDEAFEFADGGELIAAPKNFTEKIMAAVRAEAVAAKASQKNSLPLVYRIIWGAAAVLFGIALYFALNPAAFYSLPAPVVDGVLNLRDAFGNFAARAAEWSAAHEFSFSADIFGVTALFFVAVMGTLLFVLHSGEKIKT